MSRIIFLGTTKLGNMQENSQLTCSQCQKDIKNQVFKEEELMYVFHTTGN